MNRDASDAQNEKRMLLAVFLFWFSVYTYPSFLSSYAVNGLKATSTMAGMIVGSYGLTQMALRIPLGIWSDVLKKRKPFIMFGFGFSILASAGLAFTALQAGKDSVPEGLAVAALIFRGVSGITAATWVHFSVLYSASCRGDQVSAAMSRIIVPQCGSQILAMLLGALLADYLGELYAFLLATVAAVAGLAVMSRVREQRPTGSPLTLRGLLLGLGAGLGYALYSIFSRLIQQRGYSTFTNVCWTFLIAAAAYLAISIAEGSAEEIARLPGAALLAAVCGLFTGLLAYLLYRAGLREMEPSHAAQLATIEPVFAALLGAVLFSQRLSLTECLGIALVVISVVGMNLRPTEEKAP